MSERENENGEARGAPRPAGPYASEYHAPVLCHAVVTGLIWNPDGTYVDGTLGGGGHTSALLDALSPRGSVVAFDHDDDALAESRARLADKIANGRLIVHKGNFADLQRLLDEIGLVSIDGLLLDLGVSSHQFDEARRGFSHRAGGPLDMRMDQASGESAAHMLNAMSIAEITELLQRYGEEPAARRIALAIEKTKPLIDTISLADAVRRVVPERFASKSLARVFQAVRIAVNSELVHLEAVLRQAVDLLVTGGRLAVISYHSLEDRRVKRFIRSGNFEGVLARDVYGHSQAPLRDLTRKVLQPSEEEVAANPRARSARLRLAERVTTSDRTH